MLSVERRVVADLTESADPAVRAAVAGWCERSLDDMPDGLRLGVKAESLLLSAAALVARPSDLRPLLTWMARSPIGVVRAYPRLVRSLVVFGELELAGPAAP
jgi:hypothetical protein